VLEEEKRWLLQARNGDEEAFSRIVEAYQRPVYNLCYRMLGDRMLAEDAAQETFLRAYLGLKRYDPKRAFINWLLSIASNHCIDGRYLHRSADRRQGARAGEGVGASGAGAGVETIPASSGTQRPGSDRAALLAWALLRRGRRDTLADHQRSQEPLAQGTTRVGRALLKPPSRNGEELRLGR